MELLVNTIYNGNLKEFKKLVDSSIDIYSTYGPHNYTLLFISILYNQYDIFNELLKYNININKPNDLNQTAISVGILHGYSDIVEKLLEYKANIYIIQHDNYTALKSAIFLNNLNKEHNYIYKIVNFADKAFNNNIEFFKIEIFNGREPTPYKVWINYLSPTAYKELLLWSQSNETINALLGSNNKLNCTKYIREIIVSKGLIRENIMNFLIGNTTYKIRNLIMKLNNALKNYNI